MVMVPGLGDDIQAIKAGIMEIGDVFAINKADRDGAARTKVEIEMSLDFNHSEWRPPVCEVVAIHNKGVDQLLEDLKKHRAYLESTGHLMQRRIKNSEMEILELTQQELMKKILGNSESKNNIYTLSQLVANRDMDPYSASEKILDKIMHNQY